MQLYQSLSNNTRIVLIAVVLMSVMAIPVAVNAHSAGPSPGIIHACMNEKSGFVEIVDATEECKKGWMPLDWNAVGPQGPPGEDGVSGYEIVTKRSSVGPGERLTLSATCPAGKKVLGGGGSTEDTEVVALAQSFPESDGTRWTMTYDHEAPQPAAVGVETYAICANVS